MLLLGGIDKARVLREFRAHIFFDDQLQHIEGVAGVTPSAHVLPFGVSNEPTPATVEAAYVEFKEHCPDTTATEAVSAPPAAR